MNDRDTGRDVRALFAQTAPSRGPEDLLDHVFLTTSRKRPRPRWLALIKEPPMRLSSRLAVGSPMARLAAIAAATLLLAVMATGAVIGGATLLAGPAVIVVAQDGSGDHTTITAAVAAADDGDTVLVRPGTYVEAVVIEEDISLKGDGPREEIVIEAPEDGPTSPVRRGTSIPADPYAVLLMDSRATVSNLTFRGERSQVHVNGGSPTLTNLAMGSVGVIYRGGSAAGGNSVVINGGSTATITSSTFMAGGPIGVFDGSEPLIEGNTLTDGPHIWGGYGDGAIIRGNTITGTLVRGIGVFDEASLTIEGNTIIDPGQDGLTINSGSPTVTGNVISGATFVGISVTTREATVVSNTLRDNNIALSWAGQAGLIECNEVSGGTAGIVIGAGSPRVRGNVIEDVNGRGLAVTAGTSPTLTENRSCGNGTNLFLADGATATIEESNELCPEAPAG